MFPKKRKREREQALRRSPAAPELDHVRFKRKLMENPSVQSNAAAISASLATVFMLRAVPALPAGMTSRVSAMPSG